MNRIKLTQLVKEILADQKKQKLNEGVLSSQVLKIAKDAIDAGTKVTVLGKQIKKIVPAAGAFFPTDGGPSIRLYNLENPFEDIRIADEPIDKLIVLPEPKPAPVDTRTPEEIEAARQAWQDRWGPGGGQDTLAGRYTGD